MKLLGGLSAEEFLHTYWQKKPYLIRQAIADYLCPFTPEELGGLALEEEVESRLIVEDSEQGSWLLKNGPFKEEDLTNLPDSHWTLLIQATEKHIPYMSDFLDCFNFIPNWRRDDVMISFAQDQGNVGPHLDSYDVFLFQAYGEREWSINASDYSEADILQDNELRLIPDFKAKEAWLLKPGDMLYLPPGVAHHGTAQGDCMTFSVGFRAPTQMELLNDFCDQASLHQFPTHRYSDPHLQKQANSGEIPQEAIVAMREFMLQQFADDKQFSRWYANYCTAGDFTPEQAFPLDKKSFLASCEQYDLMREGAARAAYIEIGETIHFYINGEDHPLPVTFRQTVIALCNNHRVDFEHCDSLTEPASLELLYQLYQKGYYFFDE